MKDPILNARPDYYTELYPRMLIDDVNARMVPLKAGGKTDFKVLLKPQDRIIEALVTSAISRHEYSDALTYAVEDFLRSCVDSIMTYDESVFEIVYLSDSKSVVGFELVYIHPLSVRNRQGKLLQYVPVEIARKWNVSEYVELCPDNILVFSPPKHLRGKLRQIMECLYLLSVRLPGSLLLDQMRNDAKPMPYDSTANLVSEKRALAAAGKAIGWNARDLFREDALEYYLIHRRLLFERFAIEIRESIMTTLNEGLSRAGKRIGFSAQLSIEGVPTLQDVENAETHLESGDLPFRQVLQLIK